MQQFNPIAYRQAGMPVKAMKNEANHPVCIQLGDEHILVPGGWALAVASTGAVFMMRNQDADDTLVKDEPVVTLDAFVNTVNDLRHSLRMITSQQAETDGALQGVLAGLTALTARVAALEGTPAPAAPV